MSTVTLYTNPESFVADLARLDSGHPANLFLNPSSEYVSIVFDISEYVFSDAGASSLVQVRKRPVS
jgi:hypothetical protein